MDDEVFFCGNRRPGPPLTRPEAMHILATPATPATSMRRPGLVEPSKSLFRTWLWCCGWVALTAVSTVIQAEPPAATILGDLASNSARERRQACETLLTLATTDPDVALNVVLSLDPRSSDAAGQTELILTTLDEVALDRDAPFEQGLRRLLGQTVHRPSSDLLNDEPKLAAGDAAQGGEILELDVSSNEPPTEAKRSPPTEPPRAENVGLSTPERVLLTVLERREFRRHTLAMERLKLLGATFNRDSSNQSRLSLIGVRWRGLPAHLGQLRDVRKLLTLSIEGIAIEPDLLDDVLRNNPTLDSLRLLGTSLDAEGLRSLALLPHLRALDLRGEDVADDDGEDEDTVDQDGPHAAAWPDPFWTRIGACSSVEVLRLHNFLSSDPGVAAAEIGRLPRLKTLELTNVNLTDDVITDLFAPPDLAHLSLAAMPITGRTFAAAPVRETLRVISLENCPIEDGSVATLTRYPNLVQINLSQTKVTAKGVADLSALKSIDSLKLQNCDIGDEIFAVLEKINVKRVYLGQTRVTPEAMAEFRKTHPTIRIF